MTEDFLRTWSMGDTSPYVYFHIFESDIDFATSRVTEAEADLSAYTAYKFCARHESSNMEDFNDHSKDDIYQTLILDGGGTTGWCHYAWQAGDHSKEGKWYARLELTNASGEVTHYPKDGFYTYFVSKKMPGTFGIT